MLKKSLSVVLLSMLVGFAVPVGAQAQQQQVYGWQLMTDQERATHQSRMQNAESAAEREQIRAEHHKQMQVRAKERGVTLPDPPPARAGKGQGKGKGKGK